VSLQRLAGELGISKSGLFAHFGSKEELHLATVDEAARVFTDEVLRPGLRPPAGIGRIWALCEAFLSYVERDVFPGGCFFEAALAEFDSRQGPVRDRIVERMDYWSASLVRAVREAQAAGEVRPELDADQVGWELGCLLSGRERRARGPPRPAGRGPGPPARSGNGSTAPRRPRAPAEAGTGRESRGPCRRSSQNRRSRMMSEQQRETRVDGRRGARHGGPVAPGAGRPPPGRRRRRARTLGPGEPDVALPRPPRGSTGATLVVRARHALRRWHRPRAPGPALRRPPGAPR